MYTKSPTDCLFYEIKSKIVKKKKSLKKKKKIKHKTQQNRIKNIKLFNLHSHAHKTGYHVEKYHQNYFFVCLFVCFASKAFIERAL